MHIELTYGPEGEQTKIIELTKLPSQLGLLQMRAAQARILAQAQAIQKETQTPDGEGNDTVVEQNGDDMGKHVETVMRMLAEFHAIIKPYMSPEDFEWVCEYLPFQTVAGVTEAIISTREVPAALQGKSAARLKR